MRAILATILALALSAPCSAAVAILNHHGLTGGGASTVSMTLGATPTNGNYLIWIGYASNNTAVLSATDSHSVSVPTINTGQIRIAIAGYTVSGSPTGTYSGSTTAGNFVDYALAELTGVNTSTIYHGNCSGSTTCTATPTQSVVNGIAVCVGQNASNVFTGTTLNNISGSQAALYSDATTSIAEDAVSTGTTTCTVTASSGTVRGEITIFGPTIAVQGCPPSIYPCPMRVTGMFSDPLIDALSAG